MSGRCHCGTHKTYKIRAKEEIEPFLEYFKDHKRIVALRLGPFLFEKMAEYLDGFRDCPKCYWPLGVCECAYCDECGEQPSLCDCKAEE